MRALAATALVLLSFVPASAADEVCHHSDAGATCIVAGDYGYGEGPCEGYAYAGGEIGVRQWSSSGNSFLGVQNQCYSGTDPQGNEYHGTTIGVYSFENGPEGSSNGGLHLNTGEHSAYGPYCFLGEPADVDPAGVQCPAIVAVPFVLHVLP